MSTGISFRKPDVSRPMGIEIECQIPSHKYYDVSGQFLGFFYGGEDGSINRPYGFRAVEFVSQPLSAAWLIKEINRLWKRVGGWQQDSSCGIHIHVSRKWLNVERAKLIYAFYKSLDNATQMAMFGRATNSYCGTASWGSTRYNAVNNENKDTIEFRMFSSGDAAWASYCVKMVCYLIHNAKHLNVDATQAFVDLHRPN